MGVMSKRNMATVIIFAAGAILAIYVYIANSPPPAHKYDALAKCIANTSTTFYGAFWCPHCREQETRFGTGADYLPYHECSKPDGAPGTAGELQSCIDAGIQNYPTWVFPDGTNLVGVQTVEKLAEKTGCPLPSST